MLSVILMWLGVLLPLISSKPSPTEGINRYILYFVDKVGSRCELSDVSCYLSARSIARRSKHDVSPSEQDLPVSDIYTQDLFARGVRPYFSSRWLNAALLQCTAEQIDSLKVLPYVRDIVFVAPGERLSSMDTISYALPSPPPPKAPLSSSTPVTNLQNSMLNIEAMHQAGFRGEGLLIAVTDGGFRTADTTSYFYDLHKDARVLDSYDFVGHSEHVYHRGTHGTAVLSTMAAYKAGEFTGIAPKADYALYLTEDVQSEYRVEEYNWLFAAERADSLGADILQVSLGYKNFDADTMNYANTMLDGEQAVITRAANMAHARGMLVIVAMGNAGEEGLGAPADAQGVISVAAVGYGGERVPFSSTGFQDSLLSYTKPDLAALGLYTICIADGGLAIESGTSLATPQVSGLAAGLWQAFFHKSNSEIASMLHLSGDQAQSPDHLRGYGVPHFFRAIEQAAIPLDWTKTSLQTERKEGTKSRIFMLNLPKSLSDTVELLVKAEVLDLKGQFLEKLVDLRAKNGKVLLNLTQIPAGSYKLEVYLQKDTSIFDKKAFPLTLK